jgi:hypothetical protein
VSTGNDVRLWGYNGATLVGTAAGSAAGQFTLSLGSLALTRVVIGPGTFDDWVGVDNISFTPTAVPLPGSLGMLCAGLVGLLALRRQRGRWLTV